MIHFFGIGTRFAACIKEVNSPKKYDVTFELRAFASLPVDARCPECNTIFKEIQEPVVNYDREEDTSQLKH